MPLSIARMIYAKVVLGKSVDWRIIKIQLKSNMIASPERFIGLGRNFLHGGLDKKMVAKVVDNLMVVWLETSSDDVKTGCDPFERHCIEATIKGKMLKNTLNDMVDNDNMEDPCLLPTIDGGDYGQEEEGSGYTKKEGMPNVEAFIDPFGKIIELEDELASSRALVEEYKAKIEKLEHDLMVQENIVKALCGSAH
jgi:hypothetical protein